MTNTFNKQYAIVANSPKYGSANVTMTLSFDNDTNTSIITFVDGFIVGGQTTGYTGEGVAQTTCKTDGNTIKLYSFKALTKLGTNHITLYKSDEQELNKQTRFICDLTMLAITIKSDIYNWRKTLKNDEE
jgi:hypothetical protein